MSKRGIPDSGRCLNAQGPASLSTSSSTILLAGGLIALATLAAYCNCYSVPFILDDKSSITSNPTIQHLWPIWRVLSPPAGGLTVSGRPLLNLSFALNHALGGTVVWGYHAVNLAVHILASLTLFGIVRRTLLQPALQARFGVAALPLALAVALLWAVHPLQTESVTYVVQRAESLMGLFYLLTLYCFIRGTEAREALLDTRALPASAGVPPADSPGRNAADCRRDAGAPGAAGWSVLAIAACVLGMATKEVMVSAPLMVLLYDRTFVAGTVRAALRLRWWLYAGLAAGWLLLAFEYGGQNADSNATVSPWAYTLTQSWAIPHYLRLSVWPHPLVFDYGTFLPTRVAQVAPSVLIVVLLAGGAIVSLWRWPALGFLGFWFFAILAPTSSMMPLAGQTVAEHRMYLPLAAVVTLAVLGIYRLARRPGLALFALLAVALIFLTARRNTDYRSELVLWGDTAAKHPDNARAQCSFGSALLQSGQVDEALEHFQKAADLQPRYVQAQLNLGLALMQKGRVNEANRHFQNALDLQPDCVLALNNLGAIFLQSGRFDEAITRFRKVLDLNPDSVEALNNLGTALTRSGRVDEAIAQFQKALRVQPEDADTFVNLGVALRQAGRLDEARAQFNRALAIRPGDANAHNNLGNVLLQQGEPTAAIDHWQKALEAQPGNVTIRNNLAWVLATCPDATLRNGGRAVELAQQASDLSGGDNPIVLRTLAAALAEAGRFPEAVTAAGRALQLATAQNNAALADSLRAQLELYQAGSPFRDSGLTNVPASPARP